MSTMPKIVMPRQISWQLVVKKSAGSVQARGAEEFVVEGEAFVGTASAARASAAPKRAAPARKAAQIPSFAIRNFRKANTATRKPGHFTKGHGRFAMVTTTSQPSMS